MVEVEDDQINSKEVIEQTDPRLQLRWGSLFDARKERTRDFWGIRGVLEGVQ